MREFARDADKETCDRAHLCLRAFDCPNEISLYSSMRNSSVVPPGLVRYYAQSGENVKEYFRLEVHFFVSSEWVDVYVNRWV